MTGPTNEARRQSAITELDLLGESSNPAFDELVELAASVCRTPMSAFSVLAAGEHRFRAKVGLAATTPSELAFCNFTVEHAGIFEVPDAKADPAFRDNPMVTGEPNIRFYAGVPVGRTGDVPVGTLCVLDTKPRSLDEHERKALLVLGRSLSGAVELQAKLKTESQARRAAENSLERADRLATVGSVAAGLAHELGTPLAIIAGRAKMMAAGSIESSLIMPSAKVIADQADRMAIILRQLMDFARRREPRKARFDLRLVVSQTALLLEPIARKAGVQIVVKNASSPVAALYDSSQMSQVLTNLTVNAIQATPRSGCVELGARVDNGVPSVRIKDTGSGISPENLERLFEPFFTTKQTGEGTGLGLSVALAIVEDHEGTIDVDSTPQNGSCFVVRLPG